MRRLKTERVVRWVRLLLLTALAGVAVPPLSARPAEPQSRSAITRVDALALTVQPDHPAIRGIATSIRQVTTHPLEQLAAVQQVTRLLVEYDSDRQVYGKPEYHATLEQMLAKQRAMGWDYLRDDCDGRAVFAAHLLAALELPWRLEACYWKGHAWVSVRLGRERFDLLDLQPGDPELHNRWYRLVGRRITRSSHPPPAFDLRRAWQERTESNGDIGLRLGLVQPGASGQFERRTAVNWTARRASPVERAGLGHVAAEP